MFKYDSKGAIHRRSLAELTFRFFCCARRDSPPINFPRGSKEEIKKNNLLSHQHKQQQEDHMQQLEILILGPNQQTKRVLLRYLQWLYNNNSLPLSPDPHQIITTLLNFLHLLLRQFVETQPQDESYTLAFQKLSIFSSPSPSSTREELSEEVSKVWRKDSPLRQFFLVEIFHPQKESLDYLLGKTLPRLLLSVDLSAVDFLHLEALSPAMTSQPPYHQEILCSHVSLDQLKKRRGRGGEEEGFGLGHESVLLKFVEFGQKDLLSFPWQKLQDLTLLFSSFFFVVEVDDDYDVLPLVMQRHKLVERDHNMKEKVTKGKENEKVNEDEKKKEVDEFLLAETELNNSLLLFQRLCRFERFSQCRVVVLINVDRKKLKRKFRKYRKIVEVFARGREEGEREDRRETNFDWEAKSEEFLELLTRKIREIAPFVDVISVNLYGKHVEATQCMLAALVDNIVGQQLIGDFILL